MNNFYKIRNGMVKNTKQYYAKKGDWQPTDELVTWLITETWKNLSYYKKMRLKAEFNPKD